jgi:death-on-curing protein
MGPKFLGLDDVVAIHTDQITKYGGSLGIRDSGLLQSSVAMPMAGFGDQYLHTDLYEMAAAYLFHLVQNHPFVDGNKRVGAMSAYAFLDINNIELVASDDDYADFVLEVAQGQRSKAQIAEFFRLNSRPLNV